MTYTLDWYAYDLYELLRANLTDNETEDIRQIKFWLTMQRGFWVSNETDKNYNFLTTENPFLQTLDNISVSDADVDFALGFSIGNHIKRTEELPKFINAKNGICLQGVYPQSIKGKKLTFVGWDRFLHTGNLRYNKNEIYASYMDNRIYFLQKERTDNYKLMDKVLIRGVFDNPEDLSDYTNIDGNAAYTDSSAYPISSKFYENIKKGIIDNNFKLVLDGRDSRTEEAAI